MTGTDALNGFASMAAVRYRHEKFGIHCWAAWSVTQRGEIVVPVAG